MIDYDKKEVSVVWNLNDVDEVIENLKDEGKEFVPPLTDDEKFEALKPLDRWFDNGYAPDYGNLETEVIDLYKDRLQSAE